jgi:hypothetical protein
VGVLRVHGAGEPVAEAMMKNWQKERKREKEDEKREREGERGRREESHVCWIR